MEIGGREGQASIERVRSAMDHQRRLVPEIRESAVQRREDPALASAGGAIILRPVFGKPRSAYRESARGIGITAA